MAGQRTKSCRTLSANRPDGERIVSSQFPSGWCGQYAATDGGLKYAYSAPDDREWLFEVRDDLADGPSRVTDPDARRHAEQPSGVIWSLILRRP